MSFSEDGCTERRSRLHYSSGGLDPSGNDGLLPAISGRRRTFRNRPFDAAPMAFAQGSESARIDLRCPTSH